MQLSTQLEQKLNRKLRTQLSKLVVVLTGASLCFSVTACFENNLGNFTGSSSSSSLTTAGDSFVISNVTIASPTSTTTTQYLTSIFLNTTKSTTSITNDCASSSTTASNCVCLFTWQQTSGLVTPIARSVQTSVVTVQPNLITCNAPEVYANEITNGTVVAVSVQPAASGTAFSMTPYNYTKSGTTTGGSFYDNQGNSFQNIQRYTCFQQLSKGMNVGSYVSQIPNSTSGVTTNEPLSSAFCVQGTSSSGTSSVNCTGQNVANDYTGQAYYYNLFVRQSEAGDINPFNSSYICPQVQESLANNGTVGTQGVSWPLDSSFALSMGSSTNFTVGVQAFTALSNVGDPVTANSSCFSSSSTASPTAAASGTSSGTAGNSLVNSCLGFAMPSNSDGTCPSFQDASNQTRYTYRLRRYIMLYPPIFDAGGLNVIQPQATDTVYVEDRPVTPPGTGSVPYTMKGPKPCPFSYFDKKGVTGVEDDLYTNSRMVVDSGGVRYYRPGYVATNNALWNNTNIDGIQLPNYDSVNSCSASVPVINSTKTIVSLATVNSDNPAFKTLYLRPVQPWAPHYVEDTSFQACAPLASPFKDPPLHFAKDTSGNVSWCAEVYPSQNPNVETSLGVDFRPNQNTGTLYVGHVQNFTSHVAKNSASNTCTSTVPSLDANYPSPSTGSCPAVNTTPSTTAALARHPTNLIIDTSWTYTATSGSTAQTANYCANVSCDRTVTTANTTGWQKYPLLAPAADVENALKSDPSYNCSVSYDNNGGKTGKASPAGGCCGTVVNMKTGLNISGPTSAHLEPDVPCATPAY